MAEGWPSLACRTDEYTGVYPRWNDIGNECVRETYIVAAPTLLVLGVLLTQLAFVLSAQSHSRSRSKFTSTTLCSLFRPFLTLEEAEAIEYGSGSYHNGHADSDVVAKHFGPPIWKTAILVGVALFETAVWTAYGCFVLFLHSNTWPDVWAALVILLGALTWVYAAVRPITQRKVATPTYDLYLWYVLRLAGVIVSTGALLFEWYVYGVSAPRAKLVGLAVTAVGVLLGLGVILSFPMGIPSEHVDATQIGWAVSPEDFTTLWGWITFSWVEPLLKRGSAKDLEESDVWRLSSTLRSKPLFTAFSSIKSPSLPSSSWGTTWTLATHLVRANSRDLVVEAILTVFSVILNYLGPFYLKRILDAVGRHDPEMRAKAYVLAGLAFVTAILKALTDAQHMWYGRRASSRMRSELMAVVYDKALKRKDAADMASAKKGQKGRKEKDPMKQEKAGVGKIVQLMSNDANRIGKTVSGAYLIYGAPFEIIFACTFLYQILGWSAFVGFSVLVIAMPVNHFLSRRSVVLSRGLMLARDKRMDALNELILGIKFIKFFAWENQWIRRITKRRAKELTWLKHERINQMAFSFVWQLAPTMVAVVSFFCYVALGNELTVSIAFTSIALFNMVKSPLNVIPQWIVSIMQAGVSMGRIAAFLSEDEVPEAVSLLKSSSRTRAGPEKPMQIIDGSFVWNSSQTQSAESLNTARHQRTLSFDDDSDDSETRFELLGVDLTVPEEKLTLITGPTASGKTALLMALLGEMTITSGELVLDKSGGISFSSQTTLARAVYAPTKRILLDDPLAAVDSHTARFLINNLFMGPLLEGRTVVLVTHHVELMLPCAHYLIRMYDGEIDMQGTVSELRDRGILDYVALDPDVDADADWSAPAQDAIDDGTNMIESAQNAMNSPNMSRRNTSSPVVSRRNTSSPTRDGAASSRDSPSPTRGSRPPTSTRRSARQQTVFTGPAPPIKSDKEPRKLVEDEARASGNVKWRIYKVYLQASGYFSWALLLVLIISYQGFGLAEKLWLKTWGAAYQTHNSSTSPTHALVSTYSLAHSIGEDQHVFGAHHHVAALFSNSSTVDAFDWYLPSAKKDPFFYVGVYAAIVFAAAVMATVNSSVQYNASLRASRKLFDALLNAIVYSPIRYFDVTPAGRILNRMSRDMTIVDTSLSWSLRNCSHWLATFFAGVLTVSVILPPFLLPAAFIAWLYYLLALGYVRTARDLKRMESNSRSPIFSSFAELLEGIVTVRAFSAEQRFFDVLHKQIDDTTTMWYNFWMLNRWLLLHFDALASLSVFVTTIFAISGLLGDGLAAVTITTAMSFTQSVYWCCRTATNLEMDLNSVERVV
ncbi:hypothetical protein FRC07_000064, partial [Ceratobasidium sp. 392]